MKNDDEVENWSLSSFFLAVKKPVNQLYNYSTVLGAAIKCKTYSGITLEIGTHLKTVKITSNIFAVCCRLIAGIGKKEKTKEEEEQIKKSSILRNHGP